MLYEKRIIWGHGDPVILVLLFFIGGVQVSAGGVDRPNKKRRA